MEWNLRLLTVDLLETARSLWASIGKRYKIAFFTALSINIVVFLIFIVQQPMHNHGILSRLYYTSPYEQWPAGRWFSAVVLYLFNSSNLMVVLPLATIVVHILGGILTVRLWDRHATAFSLTAGALAISLYPGVMTSFNFAFVGPVFSAPHLFAPLALLAVSSFRVKYIFAGTCLVCLMMATYQPGISIISTIFIGYVLVVLVENVKNTQDLLRAVTYKLAPKAAAIVAGAILYRVSLPLFGIAQSQTTTTITLHELPAKFLLTARESFAYLILTQPDILFTVKAALLAALIGSFLTLVYCSFRGSAPLKFAAAKAVLTASMIVVLIIATKAMYLVSANNNFWNYRYNHSLGYLYMFGFFVLFKYIRSGPTRNIIYMLFFFVLVRFAYADIGRQQVLLRAQNHYLAIANRVLYRIEHLPDIDPAKKYRVVRVGKMSRFQEEQLRGHGHTYDRGGDVHLDSELSPLWGPGDIFNYLGSKVQLQGYMNRNFAEDLRTAKKLVVGRSPWPSEDSVFIHQDMIVIYM